MPARELDGETLREIFIYLYRCWLQKYLGQIPQRLALSSADGVLVSELFSLYYSVEPVSLQGAADLATRVPQPLYFLAPSFPRQYEGITAFDARDAPQPLKRIISLVREKLPWLEQHRERGQDRKEAYETEEHGRFALWRGKPSTRLLFQPARSERYGYVVVRNAPNDFFFRKSRSCREEGLQVATGSYKRSQRRIESNKLLNFDLIAESGAVLLLHLTLAGAGYKAFPRQTPEPAFEPA